MKNDSGSKFQFKTQVGRLELVLSDEGLELLEGENTVALTLDEIDDVERLMSWARRALESQGIYREVKGGK